MPNRGADIVDGKSHMDKYRVTVALKQTEHLTPKNVLTLGWVFSVIRLICDESEPWKMIAAAFVKACMPGTLLYEAEELFLKVARKRVCRYCLYWPDRQSWSSPRYFYKVIKYPCASKTSCLQTSQPWGSNFLDSSIIPMRQPMCILSTLFP